MPDFCSDGVIVSWDDRAFNLSVSDFLTNAGTCRFDTQTCAYGELFLVEGFGFRYSLGIHDKYVILTRNQYQLACPLHELRPGWSRIVFSYNPEVMQLTTGSEVLEKSLNGVLCPADFLDWARRQSLIPKKIFHSELELLVAVQESIKQAGRKILDASCQKMFWNHTEAGWSPKPEPQAAAAIRALIADNALMGGFKVYPEVGAAAGSLDIEISGYVQGIGLRSVAVEVKKSNSRDFLHGFQQQLPAYMAAVRANYGIYVVLYYQKNEVIGQVAAQSPLTHEAFNKKISFIGLDLTVPDRPSDRNFKFE